MNTLNAKTRSLVTFIKRLGRDVRGDDETNGSLGLSRAGAVAIAAVAIAATAATTAALSNSTNSATSNTSQKINSVTGAQAYTASTVAPAFTPPSR